MSAVTTAPSTTAPSTTSAPSPAGHETPAAGVSPDVPRPRPRLRQFAGAMAGSTLEVFDWTIYSTFAPFFAAAFFAGSSRNSSQAFVNTLIVYAVGFVARPIGSLVFGRLSDRRGRRVSLFLTSATALIGTLLLALSPTRASIGMGAAIILVSARIIQGLTHGGEQPAAGAYVSEVAQPHNRGFWSSFVYVSTLAGGIVGTLLGALLTSTPGTHALAAWAWRIPFLLGALGSLVATWLVWRLPETEVFTDTVADAAPVNLLHEMARSWRPALQIIGLTLGLTIAFQNWAAINGYQIAVLHARPAPLMWTSVVTNLLGLLTLPLWGALSDRIGRRPVLFIGFGGLALTTWVLMRHLDGSWQHMALSSGISMVLLAAPLSISPALMAELVPTSIRTIGVGFSYALATAIFGGTVPALQAAIGRHWGPANFGVYVSAAVLVSLLVTLTIPETRGLDLEDADRAVTGVPTTTQEARA